MDRLFNRHGDGRAVCVAADHGYMCDGDALETHLAPLRIEPGEELGLLDTISAGGVIGLAREMFVRGILNAADLDGIKPRFGDAGAALALVEKMARGRAAVSGFFRGWLRFPGVFLKRLILLSQPFVVVSSRGQVVELVTMLNEYYP